MNIPSHWQLEEAITLNTEEKRRLHRKLKLESLQRELKQYDIALVIGKKSSPRQLLSSHRHVEQRKPLYLKKDAIITGIEEKTHLIVTEKKLKNGAITSVIEYCVITPASE